MSDEILMYAVGDVAPNRAEPATIFDLVRPRLAEADIGFCQLECNLTERGERLPQVRHTHRSGPGTAQAMRETGFNVVSFAGNHCMDWGRDGFFDTIGALEEQRVAVVGVGADIAAARKPAIVDCKGTRVAFLAYNTILPMSYWAEAERPGCVPMRAFSVYEPIEYDQPGTPCRIHTYPHRGDLAAMVDDVRKAREQADVVLVSMHWGIHFVPAVLADYQRDVGHAAIDAGADLVLGHHAHILKGVEVYKDRPIFYSLCNFAMDLPFDKKLAESKGFKEIQKLNPGWVPDFDTMYNFPPDSQKTMVIKCVIADRKLRRVSILPTFVNKQAQPEILSSSDPRFAEVVAYLDEISRHQNLGTRFVQDGDEVLVEAAP